MQCGAVNGAEARSCCLCDTRLSKYADAISVSPRAQLRNEVHLPAEPDWRSEVSQRLEAYRERHGGLREGVVQPELAFTPPISAPPVPEASQRWAEANSFEAPPSQSRSGAFVPPVWSAWKSMWSSPPSISPPAAVMLDERRPFLPTIRRFFPWPR